MAAPFDPYRVLGLSRSASADDIRRAFRKLARQYHPDVNPDDPKAIERFKEVSRANDVLGDDKKRKLFDEFGEAGLREGFDAAQARAWQSRASHSFSGQEAMHEMGDFGDLFGDLGSFFGGRRRPTRMRGQDVRATLRISFAEALRGSTRTLQLAKPDICPACQGAARQRGMCMRCGGEGVVDVPSSLQVRVPPGARPGTVLRLAGQGGAGPRGAGDLLLSIDVEAHRSFSFEGDDVVVDLPLTVPEAALGASVDVPTADGVVQLRVPPGTQPGTRLRLRGKGGQVRGKACDLYARVQVTLPQDLSEQAKEALVTLKAAYSVSPRADLRLS